MSDQWVDALIGTAIGDYQVTEHIRSGRFGAVFRVEHIQTQEELALKVLMSSGSSEDALEFEREIELLSRLRSSSNVVDIRGGRDALPVSVRVAPSDLQIELMLPCFLMEHANGSVEDLVIAPDELAVSEILRLWRAAILGVHQMHLKRIMHRDLKASNCLVFLEDTSGKAGCKVSDLGRSRHLDAPAAFAEADYVQGRGDLSFAPPEFVWAQGKNTDLAHKCADLYGLGALLFEMVLGFGLTQRALSVDLALIRKNMRDAEAGIRIDLASLRGPYEPYLRQFEDALPSVIASEAASILRALCDPVPEKRLSVVLSRRKNLSPDSLEWLIRKADILIKRLAIEERLKAVKIGDRDARS